MWDLYVFLISGSMDIFYRVQIEAAKLKKSNPCRTSQGQNKAIEDLEIV